MTQQKLVVGRYKKAFVGEVFSPIMLNDVSVTRNSIPVCSLSNAWKLKYLQNMKTANYDSPEGLSNSPLHRVSFEPVHCPSLPHVLDEVPYGEYPGREQINLQVWL